MELTEKVERALRNHFQVDHLDLSGNEGITGVMVSPDFEGLQPLDRQRQIDRALRDRSMKLTRREQDRVVFIAPFTPDEYGPVEDEQDRDDILTGGRACESFPDLLPKVESILRGRFRIDHLELVDDHGIYGSMVSPDFDGMSSSDRVELLERVFRDPGAGLTDCERRRIRFIMSWAPVEYQAKLELDSLG